MTLSGNVVLTRVINFKMGEIMAKKKATKKEEIKKPVGPVITAPPTLHGKIAILVRGGEEVQGVLLSKDHQKTSDNFAFQWKDEQGKNCISPVTKEELDGIKNG